MPILGTKRARTLAVSLGALMFAGIGSVASAQATTTIYQPDNCGYTPAQFFTTDDCEYALTLYYHQNGAGGMATIFGDVSNYSADVEGGNTYDYEFWYMAGTDTDGAGQGIRNNAASVYNTSGMTYVVYYYTGYSGHSQSFAPVPGFVNLDTTLRNADASQNWH